MEGYIPTFPFSLGSTHFNKRAYSITYLTLPDGSVLLRLEELP